MLSPIEAEGCLYQQRICEAPVFLTLLFFECQTGDLGATQKNRKGVFILNNAAK